LLSVKEDRMDVPYRLFRCEAGSLAAATAIALPIVIGAAGVGVVFFQKANAQASLQAAVDAGVLAGTALGYLASDASRLEAAQKAYLFNSQNLSAVGYGAPPPHRLSFVVSNRRVRAEAATTVANPFAQVMGLGRLPVEVSAAADKLTSEPLCLLVLDAGAPSSLTVEGNGELAVSGCAAQVNSSSETALAVDGTKTSVSAQRIGVTGGYTGTNFTPLPTDGAEPVRDPLAELPLPEPEACISLSAKKLQSKSFSLSPGTYCGGLTIQAGATVTLEPGLYIMLDGAMDVGSGASVTGTELTIALLGKNSVLNLQSNATVTLTSPLSGPYRNIQFISDRDAAGSKGGEEVSTVQSGAILEYDGIAYLPEQKLSVYGTAHQAVVRGYSPSYTLIAREIEIQGNARVEQKLADRRGIGPVSAAKGFLYGARLTE
jgi:hypothetical protein